MIMNSISQFALNVFTCSKYFVYCIVSEVLISTYNNYTNWGISVC